MTTQLGIITTDFGSSNDKAYSVTLQADGKILVAGSSNGDFALARYNTDGSLDINFDNDGKVTTDFGSSEDRGISVTVQNNGKILVAGVDGTGNGDSSFALVRYNSNGSLDATFDSDGKVSTSTGYSEWANSVISQPDGKIVVAGNSYNYNDHKYEIALVRYNENGSLDTTFDSDGKVTTAINTSKADEANSVILQPDGKLVIAGYSQSGYTRDFALVRYNANGSLDSTFDSDGIVTTAIGSYSEVAYSVMLQPDGKFVVAGESDSHFAIVRYNANGNLDTTFDSDGKVTTVFDFYSNDYANSVMLQPDGKFVVSGSSDNHFALVRYNSDGSLDTTFDSDGKVTADYYYDNVTNALLLDGKFVVAGSTSSSITISDSTFTSDFALERYNDDGDLDSSFNGGDNLVNGGASNDALDAGAGNDKLNGRAGMDTLSGGSGNDILIGGTGNDNLTGGSGNDILNGDTGNDKLTGGAGKDTFVFNAVLTATGVDTITDFNPVDDTIKLENKIFLQLTTTGVLNAANFVTATAAVDNNDYLIYNNATGALSYDADGNGAGAAVQIALLGIHPALTNADFVVI